MKKREHYTPGPANRASIRKDGEKWTLILVRDLRHAPETVWEALIDPAHLREWAPFDADQPLDKPGAIVTLTWLGTGNTQQATVLQADPPHLLQLADLRWELEASNNGTRLTLWHNIDRRFISWGAAGWHICFDVLDRLISGVPLGRIAGADAIQLGHWQRLNSEYALQFRTEDAVAPPGTPAK